MLLASLLLLVLGFLWLVWLYRLRADPDAPPNKRCHQVDPHLRSTLLVFAWLLFASAVWSLCMRTTTVVHGVLFATFGLLFALQVNCLRAVCTNRRRVRDGCYDASPFGRASLALLVVFGLVMVGVGAWGLRT